MSHRLIFAASMATLLVLAGAIAYRFLPVAQLPEVTPPHVVVTATYPSSDVVANTVTTPLEKQINGKAAQPMVSIGATYGDCIVITKGVTAADTVIVGNLQKISPGAPVQPIGGPRQTSNRSSAGAA